VAGFENTIGRFKMNPREETLPMGVRASALLVLAIVATPCGARSEGASPIMVACHDEATKRYIDDFRRIGLAQPDRDGAQVIVTSFVNDRSRYQIHYAECLARWNSTKAP
jgi:hypothetical protein